MDDDMEDKPSNWVEVGIIGVLVLVLAFAVIMLWLTGCAPVLTEVAI